DARSARRGPDAREGPAGELSGGRLQPGRPSGVGAGASRRATGGQTLKAGEHLARRPTMPRPRTKPPASPTEWLLGEVSWLLSHAEALTDYGRLEEAAVEWGRAALCEE